MAAIPNPPIEALRWAWIAGVIEGDGCITMKKNTAVVTVAMTDEDVIRRLHAWSGFVGSVNGPYTPPNGLNKKPLWYWNVSGAQQAKIVLTKIYPFLGTRRKARADEVLATVRDNNYCPNDHLYTDENTYLYGSVRRCKTCRASTARAFRLRKKVVK